MERRTGAAIVLAASLFVVGGARAEQGTSATPAAPAQNPLDVVPEKIPFNTPYGAPISLQKAEEAIHAAMAEAGKRGWPLNIAVVDAGGHLVSFVRMDGAQLASIAIAEHKRAPRQNSGGRRASLKTRCSGGSPILRRSTTLSPRAAAFR